jgi:hypothetical protein
MTHTYSQVSKLQFPLLTEFVALTQKGIFLNVDEAAKLDQRPFGSLYHRGWIGYRAGRGFYATRAGRDAYAEYMGEARRRAHPEKPLSHYFDPVAYQLKKPEIRAKLRAVA